MRPGGWVAAARRAHCHSKRKPFSHRGQAVTEKERDVVRELKKKKECERQAEVSEEDLRVSGLEALFTSFECEWACLSPSIFVVPRV